MIKNTVIIAAFLCLGFGCSESLEQLGGKSSPNLDKGDNNFYRNITVGNETEIESSRLALYQSQNSAVKDFAKKMIDDHTLAGKKVAELAQAKDIELPQRLDDKHQMLVDALKDKSGMDFDKDYVALQISAHKETIKADQLEADNGSDPKTKALANDLMDTLKMHLNMAEQLQGSL